MILKPANLEELPGLLADANARGERISGFDLHALNRVLEHKAEDMTARMEAGVTLAALQTSLAERGQWLPLDPAQPESLTIGALLATSPSGPRRFGYGTVRDYLIGLTAVLADGRVIHSGGNVVKNVAGYDLMKVFIGSRGSLGVIVEAIFKLRPLPEAEGFVEAKCPSLDEADKLIEAVLDSELTPVVFDLQNLGSHSDATLPVLVLGFAGTREELQWQLSRAAELGIHEPSSLNYAKTMSDPGVSIQMTSVLPSKMIDAVRELSHAPFIARAGNGIIYHTGPPIRKALTGPGKLDQRLKDEFDPKHILPDSPL